MKTTKTFRRLLRKLIAKAHSVSNKEARRTIDDPTRKSFSREAYKNYSRYGKQWLIDRLYVASKPVALLSCLPASMPKTYAERIKDYNDERSYNGNIFILLQNGYEFADGKVSASVKNVKEAISVMRTTKAA